MVNVFDLHMAHFPGNTGFMFLRVNKKTPVNISITNKEIKLLFTTQIKQFW